RRRRADRPAGTGEHWSRAADPARGAGLVGVSADRTARGPRVPGGGTRPHTRRCAAAGGDARGPAVLARRRPADADAAGLFRSYRSAADPRADAAVPRR